jgi:ketopantoate reductase
VTDAVVWGIGELGGVLARGLLRAGYRVTPVRRGDDVATLAARLPRPAVVALCVGEADLEEAVGAVPAPWRGALALVQNELRTSDLRRWGLPDATVCAVWFEKKRGTDVRVLLPTRVAGPKAERVAAALDALGISVELRPPAERAQILAEKNLYILTTNVAGLRVGGDTGTLVHAHRALLDALADELWEIEARLAAGAAPDPGAAAASPDPGVAAAPLDPAAARARLLDACLADPAHTCRGRVAPDRLRRTLAHADALGLASPTLRALAAEVAAPAGAPGVGS